MKKIRVAVVAGGISNEREVSLKSSAQIFEGLSSLSKYEVSFLEITPSGKWEWRMAPEKKSKKVWSGEFPEKKVFQKNADIFFIGLHGAYGEDGHIQALFDWLGVNYTGSGMTASAIGMNKYYCSELLARLGMSVPKTVILSEKDSGVARKEMKKSGIGLPCVVKPNNAGSSVGVALVKKWAQLEEALKNAFHESREAMIQECVTGREFSCGVMKNGDGSEVSALPPVEIITHGAEFFDYQAKYLSEKTEEICPAPISKKETNELIRLSEFAHTTLGCQGLSRSDFILSERDGKFYFLEINTLPGMTMASICPKEAKAAGMSFEKFLDKIVQLGLEKEK